MDIERNAGEFRSTGNEYEGHRREEFEPDIIRKNKWTKKGMEESVEAQETNMRETRGKNSSQI